MEEYKGKKIKPVKVNDIELDNSPHYFYLGKYIGFCNSDGLPHGFGELIAPPTDAKLDKEKNVIEVTIRNDHNKTPWSCNGEWENGIFVKGSYNMPPFSRHQGEFIFNNGDWQLIGEGVQLDYARSEENYNTDNVIGHIKGIFDTGRLIKGEILNSTLIEYSTYKTIEKIILNGEIRTEKRKNGDPVCINSGEIFYEIDQEYSNGSDEGQYKKYKGEIDFDRPHGKGTMIFEDGSKYIGQWDNGQRDGQGTHTWLNGTKTSGIWKDGDFIN